MISFTTPIYPDLAGLSLAGKPVCPATRTQVRRSATLSRRELRRIIADMID